MDIFTPEEVRDVADQLRRRARTSNADLLTLMVWNLACGCGLRASEIAGVRIRDVVLSASRSHRPNLYVAPDVAKRVRGRAGTEERGRRVPLTWVPWMVQDLELWLSHRRTLDDADKPDALLLVRLSGVWKGKPVWAPGRSGRVVAPDKDLRGAALDRRAVRDLFVRACRLGKLEGRRWTTHTGRHTFVTHAIAAGFPVANVRDAAGHSSLDTTSIYSHAVQSRQLDGKLYAAREGAGGV
jgi:integrase